MEHLLWPLGLGFAGLGVLGAIASLAYPVFTLWMIIDGILRTDAEYPGTETNRKVLWVLAMVLVQPVAIVYFIAVYLKVRRTRHVTPAHYTTTVSPPAQ
jgi:nitrate/nitrite transporter NarK